MPSVKLPACRPYSRNLDEVLDFAEAAAFLGVAKNTLKTYLREGGVPHRRLGTRYLFSRSALLAWLGGRDFEPIDEAAEERDAVRNADSPRCVNSLRNNPIVVSRRDSWRSVARF